ncbi:protocatechuate dioxygenase [Streptomyces glomeratus]|uniref:Dioxygenase n=1 Tax=Streptomyces glomeratus TaxID=284452 RepID=A0ABP6M0K0_9ACTN|nr:protocatechuate dioxygenase [Streptomyces glomeratus]MCF1506885.1 protocatechuate dioxygenase [Streptomyces glomeratus]
MTDSDLTRRRALTLGGAAAGAVLGFGLFSFFPDDDPPVPGREGAGSGRDGVPGTAPDAELCVLNRSVAPGPYPLDGAPLRKDVTEDRQGVLLRLRLTVRDHTHACALLAGADVEIWHCDASGHYSGHPDAPAGGGPAAGGRAGSATFLRGCQTTDAAGLAEFATVFPGRSAKRAPHINVRVRTGGTRTGRGYQGGRVNWTGQLFFPDRYTDAVYAKSPYARHKGDRTPLAQDPVYRAGGGRDGLLSVTGGVDTGLVGVLTIGIDPAREPSQAATGVPRAGRTPAPDSAASASRPANPPTP